MVVVRYDEWCGIGDRAGVVCVLVCVMYVGVLWLVYVMGVVQVCVSVCVAAVVVWMFGGGWMASVYL